jgi:hypothetical protein
MADKANQAEVERNYRAFTAMLPELMRSMPDKFVVLHDGKVVHAFDALPEALRFGHDTFGRGKFSVQEVTDRVITLGAMSYAVGHPAV